MSPRVREWMNHDRHLAPRGATVTEDACIDVAGRIMAYCGCHEIVVLDCEGRAIGVLSILDVVRGLLRIPLRSSSATERIDHELGLSWAEDELFDEAHVACAPDEPGVIALVRTCGAEESVVWAESAHSLRGRVCEWLDLAAEDAALARLLEHGDLRFRCAIVADGDLRDGIARKVRERTVSESIDHH
jgi:CBS domain-containing protein